MYIQQAECKIMPQEKKKKKKKTYLQLCLQYTVLFIHLPGTIWGW